jgi:hypothetical protein
MSAETVFGTYGRVSAEELFKFLLEHLRLPGTDPEVERGVCDDPPSISAGSTYDFPTLLVVCRRPRGAVEFASMKTPWFYRDPAGRSTWDIHADAYSAARQWVRQFNATADPPGGTIDVSGPVGRKDFDEKTEALLFLAAQDAHFHDELYAVALEASCCMLGPRPQDPLPNREIAAALLMLADSLKKLSRESDYLGGGIERILHYAQALEVENDRRLARADRREQRRRVFVFVDLLTEWLESEVPWLVPGAPKLPAFFPDAEDG